MTFIALGSLVKSLFYHLILFYVGRILSKNEDLRRFLGLKHWNEKEDQNSWTAYLVERIGKVLKVIAVVSAIVSIATTIKIMS